MGDPNPLKKKPETALKSPSLARNGDIFYLLPISSSPFPLKDLLEAEFMFNFKDWDFPKNKIRAELNGNRTLFQGLYGGRLEYTWGRSRINGNSSLKH